jgi:heme-degrading monooxygenase HmoA
MAHVLFVRIESDVEPEELERRALERRPRFREVPGLIQKIYGRDENDAFCGIYFFESREALEAYRESELARTIPSAYEATEVRAETYGVLYPLWPDRGPLDGFEDAGDDPT